MPGVNAPPLPVEAALPALLAALAEQRNAVLHAPPGAGKSTGVPPALLDAPWLGGRRILMLEPRRLAARAVADRIASLRGERVGQTVGYRMRMDSRVGPATRLEVVTEGILTRQLQRDPALEQVGCVIFDEFHERSLQADLGLALLLDTQRHLRPELRLLVMSATLDTAAVARLLGTGAVISAPGLSHPVETRYLPRPSDAYPDRLATGAILRTLAEEPGDILVFLPGAGEIRRVASALADASLPRHTQVLPLFGDLTHEEQDRAIRPSPAGERKVVLATNIAETSLTIEGVRVVIDAGLERRACFDPGSGMSRLDTLRISRASADQRRGRAGRLGPGVCLRLWTETQQRALPAQAPPEILEADLAPLALELAAWGATDAGALAWLDAPPSGTLAQARELLLALGALEPGGRISAHGREMVRLGAHPRLTHMLLRGAAAGAGGTAAALASLLGERDILRGRERDADIRARLALLGPAAGRGHGAADAGALRRVQRAAEHYRRQLDPAGADATIDEHQAGWLLACAYPDRIGRWREPKSGRYQLASGRGAHFGEPQALAGAEYIVAAELDAGERDARIFLAAPLALAEIEEHFAADIRASDHIAWDTREQAVLTRRQRRLGELLLEDTPLAKPDPAAVASAMLEGIRELGIGALPWTRELRNWQARVMLLGREDRQAREPWPEVSDAALAATLEDWLLPWLAGCSRRDHLARLPLADALHALLGFERQRRLDELAPTHLTVPSGSRIALDYQDGDIPSLSVRLQECFGLADTPRIAGGRVPVLMKLLSPAQRPVQVTQDLKSFWARGYAEVKKELKGRYPKHYWPDDPWQAQPTRRVRPR
ncbi:ATP-dependent helicase HrpB [Gammaproteobacteria bacterium PRO2]|nr:ATP-dependent helicase HrpB [Gammaproteobacteria bacterium PRO2]